MHDLECQVVCAGKQFQNIHQRWVCQVQFSFTYAKDDAKYLGGKYYKQFFLKKKSSIYYVKITRISFSSW